MLSILVPSFLLNVTAHQPLNTFGGGMPKDASTIEISEAVQKLENRIELLEKDNEKTRIFLNSSINEQRLKENNSQKYDEERNSQKYDEHFNCLKNCNSEDETCNDASSRNDFKDGVYLLKGPKSISNPFYVYCHHENKTEEAWTVIQRRQDGSVDFYRKWVDYKLGFGDLNGEYWIGLERIHQITNSRPHELLVVIYEFEGSRHTAKFSKFVVNSEGDGYRLNVDGASGFTTNDFLEHNDMRFSTIDKDNDRADWGECSKAYKGGWWYDQCFGSNLNGPYTHSFERSVYVFSWAYNRSIKKIFMAIRPKEE